MSHVDINDRRFKALEWFKDWSNYLLVATIAAIGWIAESKRVWTSSVLGATALWCLALSAVFGILTLALIPLIAEQMKSTDGSIYKVRACFRVFGFECHAYLTQACRPQHILFMAGVLLYAGEAIPAVRIAIWLTVAALALGRWSIPLKLKSSRTERHP